MCGFVGIHRFDGAPADPTQLAELAALIAHRGPDGHGVWVQVGVGPGPPSPCDHRPRRLAAADGQRRRQRCTWPSTGRSSTTASSARPLRLSRSAPAVTPRCSLALHRARGIDRRRASCVGSSPTPSTTAGNGETWLVRDRLGILPLYYVQRPGWIAFASRGQGPAARSSLTSPSMRTASSSTSDGGRSPPLRRLFRESASCRPATWPHIDRKGNMSITRYWSPDAADDVSSRRRRGGVARSATHSEQLSTTTSSPTCPSAPT